MSGIILFYNNIKNLPALIHPGVVQISPNLFLDSVKKSQI